MLAGKVDGVSADERISIATLDNIKRLTQQVRWYICRRTTRFRRSPCRRRGRKMWKRQGSNRPRHEPVATGDVSDHFVGAGEKRRGTSSSSAFAVFILMTSWKRVAAWIGRL